MTIGSAFSRRDLLKAAAIGAGALALAACSPGDTTGRTGGRGARLTIATRAQNSLNPALVNHVAMVQRLAYDALLGFDEDGKFVGVLADTFGWADDTFTLFDVTVKTGLKFSDGDVLDADAVVNSFNYFMSANGPEVSIYQGITAQKVDELKVRFQSATANPDLQFLLTDAYYGGVIISPTGVDQPSLLETSSHGIGPYLYGTIDPGNEYGLVANDDYFDKSQIHYDAISFPVMDTETAQIQALLAKQCDLTYGGTLTASWSKTATSHSSLALTLGSPSWAGLNLLDRKGQLVPALGDEKARQAMMYAVDRDEITSVVYGPDASPRVQPANESWLGFDKTLESAYSYDLAKARALLKESAFAGGFSIPVAVSAGDISETLLRAMAGYLEKIGITLDIKTATSIGDLISMITSGEFAATGFPTNGQYSVAQYIDTFFSENASFNPLRQVDDGLQALVERAQRTNTKADWAAVVGYMTDHALTLPISNTPDAWISRTAVDASKAYTAGAGTFDLTKIVPAG